MKECKICLIDADCGTSVKTEFSYIFLDIVQVTWTSEPVRMDLSVAKFL